MKNEPRWENVTKCYEGAFDLLTLCISLVETGDPMDKRDLVKKEPEGSYSVSIEVKMPILKGEKGTVTLSPIEWSKPPIILKLEMINYPHFYCGTRTVRVEPQLLNFLRRSLEGGNLGQSIKMSILVVVRRGVIVLPRV